MQRQTANSQTFVPRTTRSISLHFSTRDQVVIDVELLGFVYHWGLDVNSITAIGEFAPDLRLGTNVVKAISLTTIWSLGRKSGATTIETFLSMMQTIDPSPIASLLFSLLQS